MDRKKTLLLSFIILLAGAGITAIIFSTEPTATREGATKQTAMLVEIIDAEKGNFTPTVTALGTVEAAEDIILSPRVSGEIIQRSPDFTPGGFVNKGDELLKIDPPITETFCTSGKASFSRQKQITKLNWEDRALPVRTMKC